MTHFYWFIYTLNFPEKRIFLITKLKMDVNSNIPFFEDPRKRNQYISLISCEKIFSAAAKSKYLNKDMEVQETEELLQKLFEFVFPRKLYSVLVHLPMWKRKLNYLETEWSVTSPLLRVFFPSSVRRNHISKNVTTTTE